MTDPTIPTIDLDAAEASGSVEQDDVLAEAVSIIDAALGQMMHRELVSASEVADLLLDVRSLIAAR